MIRRFSWLGLSALLLACGTGETADDGGPTLGVRVQWLTGETTATLPGDLTAIRIILFRDDSGTFEDTTVSVGSFMMRDDGRPYLSHPLLTGLPTGTPIRITLEGMAGGTFAYVGHVGPMVLSPGERRFVDVKMYQVGSPVTLAGAELPARFLPTVTPLPDGRVLIAGGFDRVENGATCPADAPAESRCFIATASRDAYVFDASTGTFHRVAGGMIQARAGHTASPLPGGRVLLAGGASRAMFVLSPVGAPEAPSGFAPTVVPLAEDGSTAAHASFEIFLPEANAETVDEDRDGDPGRGGFTGAADAPATPGRLNQQRFLHAATAVPGQAERVLLVGGIGADGGETSWEVYDDRRPGGYGVYDNAGNTLGTARPMPSAVTLSVPAPGRVWIFGGGVALDNEDLAEVWTPDAAEPNGSVAPATDGASSFPNASDDDTPRPGYALWRPAVAAIADGTHALVVGWMGARCAPEDLRAPIFPTMPDGSDTTLCMPGEDVRSFAVDGATGVTTPQDVMGDHAFGSVATLADGRVAVVGGFRSLNLNTQQGIELFTGDVSGGMAQRIASEMLGQSRAFHATGALPDGGFLSVGGLSLTPDARTATLLSAPEVLYLDRTPLQSRSTGG